MIYRVGHPVGMADLMQLMAFDRPDLKDIPFPPSLPEDLGEGKDIFSAIRQHDILLYHPYDSFTPVVNFLRQAAHDPDVLAIKITLYRVGSNSPIVNALMEARENGKAVAALIELKARFDEENNIGWARALEHEGVHVVYGVVGLKVHAKLCMIVRREKDGIRRYMHLGTGNYNATTSRIYTDFGFFTCDRAIGEDVANLFNFLTGYARIEKYQKLLVAPVILRNGIIDRIDREIARHQQTGGRSSHLQDECTRRPVLCCCALPGVTGRRKSGSAGAGDLLSAPGNPRCQREYHGQCYCRKVPRACPDLLFP